MVLSGQTLRFTPELRASIYHFTVFLSAGASVVYFGIWLTDKGISPDEIGMINALPVLILMGINFFIGRLADKADDWRQMIIILSVIASLTPLALFFVNDFWGILLVWALVMVPSASISPVVDAATVRLTQRTGGDFGFIRAWGTVGVVFVTIITGVLTGWLGAWFFVPLLVILSALRAIASLQLPRFRAPAGETSAPEHAPRAGRLKEVLKPWFVLPLVAFALINATHAILGAFAAVVWKDHGISEQMIGPLIGAATAAEATMMFLWRRIGGRVSARQMILAAALVVVVRWAIMAFNPPVEVLFILQLSHAVTYAMGYFGMVLFIANWTSDDIAAEAQGFSFVLQQAMSVIGLLAFGWLTASFGAQAFLLASLLGAIAAACLVLSLWLKPARATSLSSA